MNRPGWVGLRGSDLHIGIYSRIQTWSGWETHPNPLCFWLSILSVLPERRTSGMMSEESLEKACMNELCDQYSYREGFKDPEISLSG